MKGASLWIGRVFELGCFLRDRSIYLFFLEVYFPINTHLPLYFRLGEAIGPDLF
jgi:hypothetical protein